MIQGGDPLGTGTGGPGFTIKDEYNNLNHKQVGTLAMARTRRAGFRRQPVLHHRRFDTILDGAAAALRRVWTGD